MYKKSIKIIDVYLARELGLPVILKNVPVVEIDGNEVMDIDYSSISAEIFVHLITKPPFLTGEEVRFMRLFMGLTLESLANSLHVTHPTILSWENHGNEPTNMTDSTEVMLRIFSAKQGTSDNELVGVLLNQFFEGKPKIIDYEKSATIVKLNVHQKNAVPKVYLSSSKEDLQILQEA